MDVGHFYACVLHQIASRSSLALASCLLHGSAAVCGPEWRVQASMKVGFAINLLVAFSTLKLFCVAVCMQHANSDRIALQTAT